jgi:hypothetical protein
MNLSESRRRAITSAAFPWQISVGPDTAVISLSCRGAANRRFTETLSVF